MTEARAIVLVLPDILRDNRPSSSSQGELGGQGMWHAWERIEKCTRF
jgi:hypothetical protein